MGITRSTLVAATTADGETVQLRALGEPMQGRDFPVVWVCTEAEWARARHDGDEPDGLPWPVENVKELAPA